MLAEQGVRVSGFSINADRPGGQHFGGNLDATTAIKLGLIDALCSGYHPPSMLHVAFKLARENVLTLPTAVGITPDPARSAGVSSGAVRSVRAHLRT